MANENGADSVTELLDRRATIQQWLDRLDAQRGSVSEKIIERVRADYERRLEATLAELRTHRDSLGAQLDEVSERLTDARDRHGEAQEELDEARLRNVIGELDDDGWENERRRLEAAVAEAAEEERTAREEANRLRQLMEQFAEGAGSSKRTEARTPAADPPPPPLSDPDATLAEPPPPPTPAPNPAPAPTPAPEPAPEPEATSFLSEIDRAINEELDERPTEPAARKAADPPSALTPPDEELPSEETAPRPGLKCPECGYTNDLSAWFCGVCGADIG